MIDNCPPKRTIATKDWDLINKTLKSNLDVPNNQNAYCTFAKNDLIPQVADVLNELKSKGYNVEETDTHIRVTVK